MKHEFTVEMNKDLCSYLERLSYDIETRKGIVTRLIENANSAVDDSVLKSPAFVTYHKELEAAVASYETAKSEVESFLRETVNKKFSDVEKFEWSIDDFRKPEARVMITTNNTSFNHNR